VTDEEIIARLRATFGDGNGGQAADTQASLASIRQQLAEVEPQTGWAWAAALDLRRRPQLLAVAASVIGAIVFAAAVAILPSLFHGRSGHVASPATATRSSTNPSQDISATPAPSGGHTPTPSGPLSVTSPPSTPLVSPSTTGSAGGRKSQPPASATPPHVSSTPPHRSSPPPAPTWTEQEGTRGASTFKDPTNASGPGPSIPAMGYVTVLCRVYAPQISSANPDGYWYKLGGSFGGVYYAVANTFWNGDIPGHTPYTHNTDFAVALC
jgi:hypothetical protein